MLLEPQNAPVTLIDTVSDAPGATDALVTLTDSFLMLLEPQNGPVKLTAPFLVLLEPQKASAT